MRSCSTTLLAPLACLALAGGLSAQNVFLVDGLGRQGTDFTDLPAAEAAAADGDVLRVAPDGGPYTPIQTSKALTLVSLSNRAVIRTGPGLNFAITGIPAGQQFTMRGFVFAGNGSTDAVLRIADCAGRVVLEQLEIPLGAPALEVTDCAGVMVQESRLLASHPCVHAVNSELAFAGCSILGGPADSRVQHAAGVACDLLQCVVRFAQTQVQGGGGDFQQPPATSAVLATCDLRAGAATMFWAGTPLGPTGGAPAVTGLTSLLRIDETGGLFPTGAEPPSAGVTVVTVNLPAVSAVTAKDPIQSLAYATDPAAVHLTVTGLPADPRVVPGIDGTLWVDTGLCFFRIGLPPELELPGLPIGVSVVTQVVDVGPGGIALSNPVFLTAI